MRVATWNINSVRLRIQLVKDLLLKNKIDVLCLQETKVMNHLFPHDELSDIFFHQHVIGMKSYNGVAILSKIPFVSTGSIDWCNRSDARHASALFNNGIELHNFYVPAGGDEPDPAINDKFAHKLQFIREMAEWGKRNNDNDAKKILLGDLNIAPLENDVWSHKQLLKVVSHTPIEIEYLEKLKLSQNWVDAVRHFIPSTEKLYSWWSYRARDWKKSNRGRRLDHISVTPALTKHLSSASVLSEVRGWHKPSDHVPVILNIKI